MSSLMGLSVTLGIGAITSALTGHPTLASWLLGISIVLAVLDIVGEVV